MALKIYSFNACDRPWSDWLKRDVVELDLYININGQLQPNYAQPERYGESARVLSLIHFSGDLQDDDSSRADVYINQPWVKIPNTLRRNAFWLIYSGSGYWELRSSYSHVHYLRYDIGRESILADEQRCFLRLLETLESEVDIDDSLWEKLYPPDNVDAAALLGLLSLNTGGFDMGRLVDHLLDEETCLETAHLQFAARSAQLGGSRPPKLADWISKLTLRDFDAVRKQLADVFGAVPD